MRWLTHALSMIPGAVSPSANVDRAELNLASSQFDKDLSWMRFPPALEQQFLADSAPRRVNYFLVSSLLSILVFNGFLPVDYLMAPDVFWLAVQLRLAWFTPFAMICLSLVWWRKDWFVRQVPPQALEYLVLLSGVLAAACLAYILASTRAPTSQYYHVGLMVIIIYGNLVQRLRFWFALAYSLLVYAIHIVGVMIVPAFTPRLIGPIVALIGATMVFTLMANYALERDERRQYLLSLRHRHLMGDLGDAQRRLQQLSRMDTLTGLFNRRHFQQYLQQAWQRAQHDHAPMAILMLDVDHFKRYNDRHGHPAGDQCLMQVAHAIQDCLRRPGDLVARYGGEEFIATLPGADMDTARKAAERIRKAIAELAIPHGASPQAPHVTVSVGVATCRARLDMREQDLIAAADAALYQAKEAGRNQVVAQAI